MKPLLSLKNIHVSVEKNEILNEVSLDIEKGKIFALMGPNGSGKSTLASVIAGHPKYHLNSGKIIFAGEDITDLSPEQRARKGVFLSFQYPKSISGVSIAQFLRTAYQAVHQKETRVFEFRKKLHEKMELLDMPKSFADRSVNEGFSGGEKKKNEILQALVLEPKLLIMDETDSGLDIDALQDVAKGVKTLIKSGTTVLLITHYNRVLQYLEPDHVAILKDGQLIKTGGPRLARQIEKKGFDHLFLEPAKKEMFSIME